jgi:predicted phosphohydrolase
LVVNSDCNPECRTKHRINVGDLDWALAIEDDLLVLTDEDGRGLMVKQEGEYRRVVTQRLQIVVAPDRFVRAA